MADSIQALVMTDAATPPDATAFEDDPVSATLGALESALDTVRERHPDSTPQWE